MNIHQRQSMIARATCCEPLEPRRLLADFSGTDGPDFIRFFAISTDQFVEINGVVFECLSVGLSVDALGGDDTIRVDGAHIASGIQMNGGDGNDTVFNSTGDMEEDFDMFFFDGGAGTDSVIGNNSNDGFTAAQIRISGGDIVKDSNSLLVAYDAVESLTFNDSNGANVIRFVDLQNPQSELTNVAINGNGGNDLITNVDVGASTGLWGTSIGSLEFTINGGAGTDTLAINNAADQGGTYTINASAIALDSGAGAAGTLTYAACESLDLVTTSIADTFVVNSVSVTTTLNAGDGNDHADVGNGNYSAGIAAQLFFNGGNGNDSILYDDAATTSDDSYLFGSGNGFDKLSPPAAATFTNSIEHKTLEAGSGNNLIDVVSGSMDLHIHANAGNDQVYVSDMVAGSATTVHTGSETAPGGDLLSVNSDSTGSGDAALTVTVDQDDAITGLEVLRNGTLRLANNAVLKKGSGLFSVLGTIDIGGGALLGVLGSPRALLTRGYNSGAWNGTSTVGAINSSLAAGSPLRDGVGHGLGSQIAPTTIGPFSIASGDTVIRYTLNGDADLNQAVNSEDFNRLSTNFGLANRIWTQGDFNYDNLANSDDFNALATNFGQSLAPASSRFGGALIGAARAFQNEPDTLEELI